MFLHLTMFSVRLLVTGFKRHERGDRIVLSFSLLLIISLLRSLLFLVMILIISLFLVLCFLLSFLHQCPCKSSANFHLFNIFSVRLDIQKSHFFIETLLMFENFPLLNGYVSCLFLYIFGWVVASFLDGPIPECAVCCASLIQIFGRKEYTTDETQLLVASSV